MQRSPFDKGLLLIAFFLLGLGVVQVYSSSFIFAIESYGNGLFFFKRQLIFALLGFFIMVGCMLAPWKYVRIAGVGLFALAVIGVALTYVPGMGIKVGGATRWLKMPLGLRFEPSELLKYSMPFILGLVISKYNNNPEKFNKWLPAIFISIPLVLLLKQPDFGSFAILSVLILLMLFAYGLPWRYLFYSALGAIPAFYFLVMKVPYRYARVVAFLYPWADPARKGFQVIQSMLSFHSGGLTGVGLGQSQGKLFFLPEAHTDFTLAILGEEWGFIGFVLIVCMFGYIVLRGFQISAKAQSDWDKAIALGITIVFGLSVFINMGVVMGLLPPKGLTLPFMSYGGSSLVVTCFAVGVLLNIDRSSSVNKRSRGRRRKVKNNSRVIRV